MSSKDGKHVNSSNSGCFRSVMRQQAVQLIGFSRHFALISGTGVRYPGQSSRSTTFGHSGLQRLPASCVYKNIPKASTDAIPCAMCCGPRLAPESAKAQRTVPGLPRPTPQFSTCIFQRFFSHLAIKLRRWPLNTKPPDSSILYTLSAYA